MENETVKQQNEALSVAIDQGRVSPASVAPDGTVTVAESKGKLQSVDMVDTDLVLGFEDGAFVIVPHGALNAISESPPNVHFLDGKDSLAALFKMAGIINPAKTGSLRIVTDNVDAEKLTGQENEPTVQDEAPLPELPAPPAPLAKVSPGKWTGLKGSGPGDVEVQDTVVPLAIAQPSVYRVGKKEQAIFGDVSNDLEQGDHPSFTQNMFTSREFKVDPSGRTDLPAGSYDSSLTSEQKAEHASPAGQATRESIYGTSGSDTIDHNSAFSAATSQWSKILHLDFNKFSEVSSIQIEFDSAQIGLIPGFDIQGAGVSRTSPNSWNIAPSADVLSYGQDIEIVYTVSSGTVTPVDFGADIKVAGDVGSQQFELTNTITLTWRDASTEADFTVFDETGALMMVLPSSGVGVEVFAGADNDVVFAGAGHDIVHGEAGNDGLYGGIGNDLLDGGAGGDVLDGGQGVDTATYVNAVAGVTAIFDSSGTGLVNSGEAAGDNYVNLENLIGSDFNDILIGDAQANTLTGGLGDDTLVGRGNSDTLDGGDGNDTASYAYAASAVSVSLASNSGTTPGEGDGDLLVSIENLTGSAYGDTLTGDGGANVLDGGAGNDTLQGGAGNDTLYAASGQDRVYGGAGDDTSHVDARASLTDPANLPGLVSGDDSTGGDTIILDNLVTGSYSLTDLANVTNGVEILDIRNAGADTELNLTSLDVRNFVDNGNASEIWIKADSGGDSLKITLDSGAGETTSPLTQVPTADGSYAIFNAANIQVALIHWQTA
jgi:Ca2+-binding RTX toxin-like protein